MSHWFVLLVLVIVTFVGMQCVRGGLAVNVLAGADDLTAVNSKQYLASANGQFSLVMRADCNLVVYNGSQPFLGTDFVNYAATPNCSFRMQGDGNFVIYNSTIPVPGSILGQVLWNVGYYSLDARSFLLLGDNGSSFFYNSDISVRQGEWTTLFGALKSSFTNVSAMNYPDFQVSDYTAWKPNSSLVEFPYMPAEYILSAGNRLKTTITSTGTYTLELGTDCDLKAIWYSSDGVINTQWYSDTARTDSSLCQLTLQPNGTLQILDVNSKVVYWNSTGVGGSGVNWILQVNQNDGSVSISDITNSNNVLWRNVDLPSPEPSPASSPAPNPGPSPEPSPVPSPSPVAPSKQPSSSPSGKSSVPLILEVLVGGVGGALVLALAVLWSYFYLRDRLLLPSERAFQAQLRAKGGTSYAFSQAKIKQATKNYNNEIGRGGFGVVYKGKLPDGREVAAKVLSKNSHQSKHEFFNEIELLSTVHHKHLVSLIGFSCTRTQQVLIYEFMGGGDLHHRLQGESSADNPLSWRQRTNIILEVAEGLEYLHDKCFPAIIHRDVKSTNILLTDQLAAKVADFGLSKLIPIGQENATHVTTLVKGTPGYLDPEYHDTGMLTEKSDVYAFGVVVMEILTGRPHLYIAKTVGEAWRAEQCDSLADPNLRDDFDRDEFVRLVELALWCARRKSAERPFMNQVVRRLYDLGLGGSSEKFQARIDLGDDYEHHSMSVELMTIRLEEGSDGETQPFSESSSSKVQSDGIIRR